MKRSFAMLLSLLLLWMQTVVMAQPVSLAAPTACGCCSCHRTDCCVTSSSDASAPQPAATTVPSVAPGLDLLALTASPAWLLPRGEAAVFSSSVSAPLLATALPLFYRDCALLI